MALPPVAVSSKVGGKSVLLQDSEAASTKAKSGAALSKLEVLIVMRFLLPSRGVFVVPGLHQSQREGLGDSEAGGS